MTRKNTQGANPTKQHSMKCPKLYGKDCTCDGFHTFEELYDHRIALFIALCRTLQDLYIENDIGFGDVWKSKLHSDGTMFDGWFIAGIFRNDGNQITYHLPIDRWDELEAIELEKAPEWDGHTPDDVISRILNLNK